MFDIGFGEFLLLGVVGLIVLGPDRLPQYVAQAVRFVKQLRQQVDEAKASVVDAVDIDSQTLMDLSDLDPRRILNDIDADLAAAQSARTVRSAAEATAAKKDVLLDPDTT